VPTYQYVCTECGHDFEEQQAFSDDALTVCPVCGGRLRKVFNSVGIVFKGSGFYRNDSRDKAAGSGKSVPTSDSTSDSPTDSTSGAKADLKPDAKPAGKTEGAASTKSRKSGDSSSSSSSSGGGSKSGGSSTKGSAA
jgi:putative FmdB family regulatory protein